MFGNCQYRSVLVTAFEYYDIIHRESSTFRVLMVFFQGLKLLISFFV